MSDDVSLGTQLALLGILLLCSAFFSGTETALMALNRYRLRHKARSGHRGARLAEMLLKRPDRLITLILFGNTLANFAAASLVTLIGLRLGGPAAAAIATVVITLVVLIFSEVTPKTLGALHPEPIAFVASYVYYPLLRVTYPLIWMINIVSNGLLRICGVQPDDGDGHNLTIDELRTLVAESGARLPRRRHAMLVGILELELIEVDDIMVPHNEIYGIDLDDDWAVIVKQIANSPYSRLPVYRDNIDAVEGLLNLKRLIQGSPLETLNRERLMELIDEPYFVPEGTPLNKQLLQFQRNRQRTGLVVDEYGDVQGLVTLEDLLEEIVGEFTTEPDQDFEDVREDKETNSWVVRANTSIRSLNRSMHWQLPTDGPRTLNGLILEHLEAIPQTGAGLDLNGYAVEILQTSGNVVKTVRIRPPANLTGKESPVN